MKDAIRDNNLMADCRKVIGWVVRQVDYTEVDYYPAHPQPCYATDHPQIHTVDFSICLSFTNHKALEVSWKNFEIKSEAEYSTYGLHVSLDCDPKKRVAGQRTWNVSEESTWQELIGESVQDVKLYWTTTWIETKEAKETDVVHPQAIALIFSNQKTIFISIAEFQAGNLHKVIQGTNNLLVTTDESLAWQTNMLSEEVNAL